MAPPSSTTLPPAGHRPPPELPVPNAEEVSRFQSLFLARFGVELSEEEAHDQARRLVQFVFLMQYSLPYLKAGQEQTSDALKLAGDAATAI